MYDKVVDTCRGCSPIYEEGQALPDPVLEEARAALDAHYRRRAGRAVRHGGLCFYRDGQRQRRLAR
ncbi:hypothetical protein [Nonomuraea dietziae]|uniref:hypothetical protein n=1 Tax=Nonomuraea dietziae TaxID=65515 RepID=UPI0031CED483